MQNRLGITARLFRPLKHQITGRLKRYPHAIGRHRHIARFPLILPIHNLRHSAHNIHHLWRGYHIMHQPIRDMLAAYPTGRPILHQPNIVDIWHLGTAYPRVNPPHHIAQNPLRIVFHLRHNFIGSPVRHRHHEGDSNASTPPRRPAPANPACTAKTSVR